MHKDAYAVCMVRTRTRSHIDLLVVPMCHIMCHISYLSKPGPHNGGPPRLHAPRSSVPIVVELFKRAASADPTGGNATPRKVCSGCGRMTTVDILSTVSYLYTALVAAAYTAYICPSRRAVMEYTGWATSRVTTSRESHCPDVRSRFNNIKLKTQSYLKRFVPIWGLRGGNANMIVTRCSDDRATITNA